MINNMNNNIEQLNWDKVNGLMPAIIQDDQTREVLMLGYMNREALQQTLTTQKVTFYSRTKRRLWVKGETSGHELKLVKMILDCDKDTLLIHVKPAGPCCHLNNPSCFFDNNYSSPSDMLIKLQNSIAQRYEQKTLTSYVAKLFEEGIYRIAQKVGEEGVEVALAGVSGLKENIVNESADLLFHLLILLKKCDIKFNEVLLELEKRAQ